MNSMLMQLWTKLEILVLRFFKFTLMKSVCVTQFEGIMIIVSNISVNSVTSSAVLK